jgi:peptide/nickel transport system substrate-binding protein
MMTEPSAIRLALLKGDIDWTGNLTPDMMAEMQGQTGIKVLSEPVFQVTLGYMNETRKPFDSIPVRQAINYALDYEAMVNNLLRGKARRVHGPIPPGLLGHDDGVFQYNRDVPKAKQLLASAGLASGFSTTLVYASVPADDQLPQLVQANLADIGVNVTLQKIAEPTRREQIDRREFDMSIGGWSANYGDPHLFMGPLFDSNNWGLAGNRSFYKNDQVNELIRKAVTLSDNNERVRLYRQAQDTIMQEAPYFLLFHQTFDIAVRDNVKGATLNPANVFNTRFDLISKA